MKKVSLSKSLGILSVVVLVLLMVVACASPAPSPSPSPSPTAQPAPKPTASPTQTPTPVPSPAPAIKPRNITYSGVNLATSAYGKRSEWFMNEVTKRTNGAITFTKNWGSSLGEPAAQLQLLQSGIAPLIESSPLYNPGVFPDGNISGSFPFGPIEPDVAGAAYRAAREKFPQFEAVYAKNKVKTLSYTTFPYYGLLSKKPANGIADLKGSKVGVAGGKYPPMWIEASGMVSVSMAAKDRYTALQSGLIEVDFLNISQQGSQKHYEVAKNYLAAYLMTIVNPGLFINLDFFNGLEPQFQNILIQTGLDAEKWHWQDLKTDRDQWLKVFKDNGVTIKELPEADKTKWASAIPDTAAMVAAEVTKTGLPGYDVAQAYQAEAEKLGWKWSRKWAVKP